MTDNNIPTRNVTYTTPLPCKEYVKAFPEDSSWSELMELTMTMSVNEDNDDDDDDHGD